MKFEKEWEFAFDLYLIVSQRKKNITGNKDISLTYIYALMWYLGYRIDLRGNISILLIDIPK